MFWNRGLKLKLGFAGEDIRGVGDGTFIGHTKDFGFILS